MITLTGKVVGVESINRDLQDIPANMRGEIRKAVEDSARRLRDHVRRNKLQGQVLNRRSGNLWDSIQYEVQDTEQGIVGTVFTDVKSPKGFPYGAYWERSGSAHGGPRPFLRPALEEKRTEIRQRITSSILRAALRASRA